MSDKKTSIIKKYPLISFFVLVFLIMGILSGMGMRGIIKPASQLFFLMFMIGSWSPAFAAAIVIKNTDGRAEARRLFSGWLKWNVDVRWYLAALSPLVIAFLIAGVYLLFIGDAPGSFQPVPMKIILALILVNLLTGALGEEPGWRGFATPRLQARFPALQASLILGVIWALFHLPLWFIPGTPQTGIPFIPFAVVIVLLTVLFTWAYNNTNGSLLIASLLHLSFNTSMGVVVGIMALVPAADFLNIAAGFYFVYAALIVIFSGHERLSRKPEKEMPFIKGEK